MVRFVFRLVVCRMLSRPLPYVGGHRDWGPGAAGGQPPRPLHRHGCVPTPSLAASWLPRQGVCAGAVSAGDDHGAHDRGTCVRL